MNKQQELDYLYNELDLALELENSLEENCGSSDIAERIEALENV